MSPIDPREPLRKPDESARRGVPAGLPLPSRFTPRAPTNLPPRDAAGRPPLAKPRRVRSGLKLQVADATFHEFWASRSFLDLIEPRVDEEKRELGLEYARLGQTRRLIVEPGEITGMVQGRAERSYSSSIEVDTFSREQWERVIAIMSEQTRYAARIIAGDLPEDAIELFAASGMALFPQRPDDIRPSCTCEMPNGKPRTDWCRHTVCVAFLIAERLMQDQLMVFRLRGMPASDLLDRMREHRAMSGSSGTVPVYQPGVPGVSDLQARPITECASEFWDEHPDLELMDYPLELPDPTHPLLRRLGPSPFETGKFPLVGLLATCYDIASEQVLARARASRAQGGDEIGD